MAIESKLAVLVEQQHARINPHPFAVGDLVRCTNWQGNTHDERKRPISQVGVTSRILSIHPWPFDNEIVFYIAEDVDGRFQGQTIYISNREIELSDN